MKSLLTVAALLTGLAAPALAGEAAPTAPPPPQVQAAVAPSQQGTAPSAQRQSQPTVAPASVMLESNAPPPSRSGCGRSKTTVYLTN